MIEVPIDKIIPLEEAALEIKKILGEIQDTDIYVITKDGKPHAAIIDIDYLEHLPEMKDAGETKKLDEIGNTNSQGYDNFKIKPNQAPENKTSETPASEPQSQPQPEPEKPTEGPEIINDNMGPWKEDKTEEKKTDDEKTDPPDLNIG